MWQVFASIINVHAICRGLTEIFLFLFFIFYLAILIIFYYNLYDSTVDLHLSEPFGSR